MLAQLPWKANWQNIIILIYGNIKRVHPHDSVTSMWGNGNLVKDLYTGYNNSAGLFIRIGFEKYTMRGDCLYK